MGLRETKDPTKETDHFTIHMDSKIVDKLRDEKARTKRSLRSIIEERLAESYSRRELIDAG